MIELLWLLETMSFVLSSEHENQIVVTISNFGFEFVLTISWLNAPSMVISIVRRHPALLLGKQWFERADA